MGHSLLIDSSHFLTLGLSKENGSWNIEGGKETKNAHTLHSSVHSLCEEENIVAANISEIFCIPGPGSYTGIRLGQGVVDTFKATKNINVFGLYHHEIPLALGYKNYIWVSNAFKKQVFVAEYRDSEEVGQGLYSIDDADSLIMSGITTFTHFLTSLDCFSFSGLTIEQTGELLKTETSTLYRWAKRRNSELGPYYYRPLDQEFTLIKKGP